MRESTATIWTELVSRTLASSLTICDERFTLVLGKLRPRRPSPRSKWNLWKACEAESPFQLSPDQDALVGLTGFSVMVTSFELPGTTHWGFLVPGMHRRLVVPATVGTVTLETLAVVENEIGRVVGAAGGNVGLVRDDGRGAVGLAGVVGVSEGTVYGEVGIVEGTGVGVTEGL